MHIKKYLIIFSISAILLFAITTEIKEKIFTLEVHKSEIINAIIQVESSGNPNAISKKGCIGLMQINYRVWKKDLIKANIIKTKKDLFVPEKNIEAGKFILATYSYKTKHNLPQTLYLYSGKDMNYPHKILKEIK